jgi:hypothetical protein
MLIFGTQVHMSLGLQVGISKIWLKCKIFLPTESLLNQERLSIDAQKVCAQKKKRINFVSTTASIAQFTQLILKILIMVILFN